MFYFRLYVFKTSAGKNLLEACSSTFANTEIEKVTTQRGAGSGHRDIERQLRMMPNRERDKKEIVPERQKKKRGVQQAKKEQAERADVGKEEEQRVDNR